MRGSDSAAGEPHYGHGKLSTSQLSFKVHARPTPSLASREASQRESL